jgi:DNA polymerase III subunit epsilon
VIPACRPLTALRRRRIAHSAPAGPLKAFYAADAPSVRMDWRDAEYVAVDLETTGRDAARDQIVSVGWVRIANQAILLSSAEQRLVRTSIPMPEQSATIHAITDDEAALGEPLRNVLSDLLAELRGRVMIAHHAATETGFLDSACRRVFGAGLLIPVVDTLELARQSYARRAQEAMPGCLRLVALREQHRLPRHRMHDALSDAIATAELFLAQMAERTAGDRAALGSVLARV